MAPIPAHAKHMASMASVETFGRERVRGHEIDDSASTTSVFAGMWSPGSETSKGIVARAGTSALTSISGPRSTSSVSGLGPTLSASLDPGASATGTSGSSASGTSGLDPTLSISRGPGVSANNTSGSSASGTSGLNPVPSALLPDSCVNVSASRGNEPSDLTSENPDAGSSASGVLGAAPTPSALLPLPSSGRRLHLSIFSTNAGHK